MSDPDGPRAPRPIRPGPVIGGFFLGLVLVLAVQALFTIYLSGLPVFAGSPASMYLMYLLPGLIGVGLLLSPRTRQAGAGLLLGVAIGAIVAAGACTVITAVVMGNLG